jgi:hypothetical protein
MGLSFHTWCVVVMLGLVAVAFVVTHYFEGNDNE